MADQRQFLSTLRRSVRVAMVWASCAGTALAGNKPVPKARRPELTQQRALQALNRFTFGPRPGDVAAVERLGLNAWFEQQLHPERIADTAWDAREAQFPAMQLSQTELMERFPPPEVLRAFDRGSISAPNDPLEAAVYADAAFEHREKKELKTEKVAGSDGITAPARAAGTAPSMNAAFAAQPAAAVTPMDPAQLQAVLALEPEERFQRLVAMSPEAMDALRRALRGPEQQQLDKGMSPAEIEEITAMQAPERVVSQEVAAERLLRDVYSERQLQAVMTDFWLNHFNVFMHKNGQEPYLLPAFERKTILPHALGRFEDLLVATAESPAMLVYLDNVASVGPESKAGVRDGGQKGINENYARELMELHTLGVNGGYTQGDVIEVAKCFTGWTVGRPEDGMPFTFNPNRHEPGSKTVLGHVIPDSGEDEGLAVLHLLATSPATAHLLSFELAQRFLSDQPPSALVNRMAATYLKTDGDIGAVLQTLFRSPEFWSPGAYRAKVKTPLEFVASALRASKADVTNPAPLVGAMQRLGMPVYGMQTPNGYSSTASAWVSSNALLTRMNFSLVMSANRLPGTHVDWTGETVTGQAAGASTAPPGLEQEARLEAMLLEQPAAKQTRAAVLTQAQNPDGVATAEQAFRAKPEAVGQAATGAAWTQVRQATRTSTGPAPVAAMAGLLLGSPDFQRR